MDTGKLLLKICLHTHLLYHLEPVLLNPVHPVFPPALGQTAGEISGFHLVILWSYPEGFPRNQDEQKGKRDSQLISHSVQGIPSGDPEWTLRNPSSLSLCPHHPLSRLTTVLCGCIQWTHNVTPPCVLKFTTTGGLWVSKRQPLSLSQADLNLTKDLFGDL